MIRKGLLSLGMLACGLAVNAQTPVFHEGFDAEQTKQSTDLGWYEFINQEEGDAWSINDDAFSGAGCLNFVNSSSSTDDSNWWKRGVKFRNLPLQEGKSYRLTHRLKGSNVYTDADNAEQKCKVSLALMQGGENADIALLDADGNEFRYSYQYLNPDSYEKYTRMFFFASEALQKSTYAEKNPEKDPLADTYFATINVYNPGSFFLDEVDLVESSIAGIEFAGDIVRVDFGYSTNAANLAKSTVSGRYLLPNDCVTVKYNGEETPVASVELMSDGYMYIFLSEVYSEDASDKIEVAFKSPSEVKYSGTLTPGGQVLDFEAENGDFNEDLKDAVTSYIYEAASIEETTPIDGSFANDVNTNEITVKFDRDVYTVKNDMKGAPTATLNGEPLTIKEGQDETTSTITFVRASSTPLEKGQYTVTINDVVTSVSTECPEYKFTFEVGKVQTSETVYTEIEDGDYRTQLETEGGIPTDWTLTVQPDGGDPTEWGGGSGARGFIYSNSNVQSAFYLRDWDGHAVASRKLTIPAGNTELRAYSAGWATTGSFTITLTNSAGEKVINELVPVSTQLEKNKQGNFQIDAFRFVSDGGEYTYSVELANGSNELLHGGFKLYSYYETEGDKAETETVATGNFAATKADYAPAHGTGWKIYRNDGRMRDPGANCTWGGDDWTGGGGPRVKTMGNKGMNGAGVYLASGCYATYGEYLLQTDHAGTVEPEAEEKTLDLKAAKYQIDYYIIGWKNPGSNYTIKLDIYNQEDGITGSAVYSRLDTVTVACGSGNDASSNAKNINFFWNAPKAGKYIMKFTAGGGGEGECCFGNVSVETTTSLAITYANLMKEHIAAAKEELEAAMASDNYAGTTRSALEKAINDYTDPDFHLVSEYTAAFAELDQLVKKSATRRTNIDKYPTALASIQQGLEAAQGTKYEALEQFPVVEQAYNDYKDVDYVALDDDALQTAVDVMGNNGALLTNMVNTCVPLITTQITNLAAAIVNLDETTADHEYVLAASDAISDDQALVANLKKLYASKIYTKIASGEDIFSQYDEEMLDYLSTPIEASFLIQNPQFYTTAILPTGKDNVVAKTTDFPGWNIEVITGEIKPIFTTAWGGTVGTNWTSEVYPYANCAVKTSWGTAEYDVNQLIDNLPVAKYDVSIKIGEDGSDPHGAYAYVGEGESQMVQEYVGSDGSYTRDNNTDANNKIFEGVAAETSGNLGSILLGGHMKVAGGFGNIDDAALTMVGKVEGFDYAKAAEELVAETATAVKSVKAAEGEPTSVRYYDLNGVQTTTPSGVCIKIATYKNGVVQVSKAIVK